MKSDRHTGTSSKADQAAQLRGQARQAAVVIAATAVLWIGAQWLGGRMGWEERYAFLFDMVAIAALVWALIVTFRIWRRVREMDQNSRS